MDANQLHDKISRNLLDQIAADPGMINRPLGAAKTDGVAAAPSDKLAPAPVAAPVSEPVVLLHPDEHLPANPPAKSHKLVLLLVTVGIFMMVSGGGAAAYYSLRPLAAPAVHATASPSPKATPTPSPSPSPAPTASPSPSPSLEVTPTPAPSTSPTPAPVEVTAPTAAPSAEHPQTVTVKSSSGLWLRSSASSANRKNIIGWLPNGAKVSVDSIGSFWWHGTYSGKTGYFAVNYTK